MKTPRIYSAGEARALRAAAAPAPWETAFGRTYGENPRYEYFVRMVGGDFAVAADVCGEDEMPSKPTADLIAAAHDLAASVEHHAARADELSAECVKLRVAWVRETHRSDDATARADAAESALAVAHARIADLERLAAGPRTPAVDDGLARPFAPETLPGWDADGREVGR